MRNSQDSIIFGSLEDKIQGPFKGGNAQTEEEYKLKTRKEDRLDRDQVHRMRMEHLSFCALCIFFLTGVFLYNTSSDKTIGTALITGPVAALIDRNATLSSKKKNASEAED
jgi:hypothetical protein